LRHFLGEKLRRDIAAAGQQECVHCVDVHLALASVVNQDAWPSREQRDEPMFVAIANPGSKIKHGKVCVGAAHLLLYRFQILSKAADANANTTTIRSDFEL
jgi:hypothetical protein